MRHKIAIYLRVSTDEQAVRHEGSLDSQKHRLNAFVDLKNVQDPNWGKVVETYSDDGISAKDTNRPAFQRMMKDLRKGKINLILVTDLSRLSRNIMDFCVLLEELKRYKAQFLSIKEQFDATTAAGEMMVFNMINLAQFERKQTSERVTLNFHARALRGLRNGGCIPLGYQSHAEDPSKLVVNEDEANDIKAIFNIYLQEGTLARAVMKLNHSLIRPRSVTRSDCRHNQKGRWTIQSLQSILRNYSYAGLREVNKKNQHENQDYLKPFERYQIVKAAWPAIIDQTLFEEVQKSLDQNQKLARSRIENAKSRVFLVSGFLFCGECSRPMMGTTGHGRSDEYRYYVHRPIPGEKVTCAVKTVRAHELEQAILNQMDHVLFREGYLEGVERRIDEIVKPQMESRAAELENRRSQLALIQKQIQAAFRLHADMGSDGIDDLFKEELLRLKTEKSKLESAIRDLEANSFEELTTGKEGRRTLEINLSEYRKAKSGASQLLLKKLMRKVIESIVLEPNRIALNYWTSNELRDENLSQKTKRPTDSKSGASVLPMRSNQPSPDSPSLSGSWDQEDFGLLILKNGRVSPTNYEQRQPHDYIELPSLSKQGISEKVAGFYASGMSLSQISQELNCSKNYVRKTLMDAGVDLRASCRFPELKKKEPKKYRTGNAPFGYRILRGHLIVEAREIEIVRLVMNLWTAGNSYNAITKLLNVQNIKNRKGTPWDHSLVRSIVERHKDKPFKLEEIKSWDLEH